MWERLDAIERLLNQLSWQVAGALARIAGLEQTQWQQWGMSGGGAAGDGSVAYAKVTGQISKATSATALGTGSIQRYTTCSGGTLGGLTGTDETCYSVNQDYKVAVNATVLVRKVNGSWTVDTVDKCTNLVA